MGNLLKRDTLTYTDVTKLFNYQPFTHPCTELGYALNLYAHYTPLLTKMYFHKNTASPERCSNVVHTRFKIMAHIKWLEGDSKSEGWLSLKPYLFRLYDSGFPSSLIGPCGSRDAGHPTVTMTTATPATANTNWRSNYPFGCLQGERLISNKIKPSVLGFWGVRFVLVLKHRNPTLPWDTVKDGRQPGGPRIMEDPRCWGNAPLSRSSICRQAYIHLPLSQSTVIFPYINVLRQG